MLPKRSRTISAAISLLFAPVRLYDAPSFAKFKILWRAMRSSKRFWSIIHWIMKPSRPFWPTLSTKLCSLLLRWFTSAYIEKKIFIHFSLKEFMLSWMLLSISFKSPLFFIIRLGFRSWETSSFVVISSLSRTFERTSIQTKWLSADHCLADIEFVKKWNSSLSASSICINCLLKCYINWTPWKIFFSSFNTKTAFLEFIINILMCFTELQKVTMISYQLSSITWMIKSEKVISYSQ